MRAPDGGFSSLGLSRMFDRLSDAVVRRKSAAAVWGARPVTLIVAVSTALMCAWTAL